ncbi:cell adhesion molecule CEACAM3-like [Sarcophilus harrisii]
MESSSEPQSGVLSPWRGLLFTASILSCWIHPTSAQVSVVPNPPYGEVNHNVTLDIQGFSGQALFYTWYRKAVAEPNRITRYTVETGEQDPAGIREKVFPNGSLLIPDLTLSDTDDYHVTIVNSRGDIILGQGNLAVYEQSLGGSNGSTVSRRSITVIVIGVLAGIILIGTLIFIQFFRRRASKQQLSEKNHSEHSQSEDTTLYETVHLPGSALPAQGLGSSPAFSEVPPESSYETLNITKVDVYDKLNHWKQPEA